MAIAVTSVLDWEALTIRLQEKYIKADFHQKNVIDRDAATIVQVNGQLASLYTVPAVINCNYSAADSNSTEYSKVMIQGARPISNNRTGPPIESKICN